MSARASGAKILIVEDESIIATNVQQALVELGYDAYAVAASGEAALRLSAERRPDLALVNIRITGHLDGVETAEKLRQRFAIPVVYLTAHFDVASIERAQESEPYGYLVKPVKASELHSTIEVALHKHRLDARLRQRERQLEMTERLAALGTLATRIAHEIDKPLSVVVANAEHTIDELSRRDAERQAPDAVRSASIEQILQIQRETLSAAQRIRSLISDLNTRSGPACSSDGAEVSVAQARAAIQRRARVLVVEDEEMLLKVMRRALESHDVVCAPSGQAAIELLQQQRFDVVIVDLLMPHMTGVEFYARLSKQRPDDAARVVFITGGDVHPWMAAMLATLPNRCIEKPFNVSLLRSLVQERLSQFAPVAEV